MGTVTVTVTSVDTAGSRRSIFGTIALSASYATGGDAFTAGQFGLESLDELSIDDAGFSNGILLVAANVIYPTTTGTAAAGKIQAFGAAGSAGGLTEIASASNLSAYTTVFEAKGW